ncbi:hypothetical protein HBH64_047120 [Parastagonospora nodorum]|nr:hypothetical protein HBI02_153400 [Parastagonospora nodorum]KAH4300976.1 hypothetical protein HBI01_101940 [Parastagonospora nodorum]KAH4319448.1 hypothetical protein HBI00_245430 [Parastagonospora nodorum]KAH4365837.1 hypothetical protein HBH94_156350 [Parastagonospora nodorum]KAH4464798.1 hypothetical protein HBH90_102900 [Parastagonospora nodorum]
MSTHDLEPALPPSSEKSPEDTTQFQKNLLQDEEPGPVRTLHGCKWFLAYSSLLSTVLFYALDGTIVAAIQPQIIETFGETEKLPWIGVGMFLGALSILPIGKAFGVFNVKWLFLGVVTLFEVGSAVCGAAPSMDAFIIGRVLQGIGACGCYAGAVTYVSITTSTRERPIYISGVLATWSVGSVVGPLIGGAFAQSSATWRWAFYINIVFAAFTAPWLILYLPNIDPAKDLSFKEKMARQDWLGIVIFMGGATCLSLGLTFGGTVYSWSSASEILLWTLSGVLLVVFLFVTIYHPTVTLRDRLYPLHLMKRLELNLLELALFMASGCMVTTLYYIPLLFQFTRNDGPLKAGARLMPFLAGLIFFSILNGALMPKLGYHMPWYVLGTAMVLVGTTLMSVIDASTSEAYVYGATLLIGSGCGAFFSAGFSVIQNLLPISELSDGISFLSIGQQMGFIVMLSISGTIFQNIGAQKISQILPDMPLSDVIQLTTGTHSAIYKGLGSTVQVQVVEQITFALHDVFFVMVAGSALAFIGSLFLNRRKLY